MSGPKSDPWGQLYNKLVLRCATCLNVDLNKPKYYFLIYACSWAKKLCHGYDI